MTARSNKLIRTSAVLSAFAFANYAGADTVEMQFQGVSPSERIRVYLDTDQNGSYDYEHRVRAGVMNWTDVDTDEDFSTFCIELTQYISTDQVATYTTYDDATAAPRTDGYTLSDTKVDKLSAFWAQYRNLVVDSDTASAFQVSVWEIVYDGDGALDISRREGNFYTASSGQYADTYGIASAWLHDLDLNGPRADLQVFANGNRQDQINATGVPTPSAALLGMALLGANTVRRRRREA